MDGEDPSLFRDSRGSFHASPHNMDEVRTKGVVGKAVVFDGQNDYLELPLDSHPHWCGATDHFILDSRQLSKSPKLNPF